MQWHRSDYLDLMTFGHCARPMFVELFGPAPGLQDPWRAQGAIPDELDLTAFDFDFVPIHPCGGNTHPLGPLPIDGPVQTMDHWLRLKPLFAFRQDRINWTQVQQAQAAQNDGALVVASIPGVCDTLRQLLGETPAALDRPELLADILQTLSDTAREVLEPIAGQLTIDQLSVTDNLADPALVRQGLKPGYRHVWEMLADHDCRIFQQQAPGNLNPVLDELLACGLSSIYPVESAAGMDIVQVRQQYGRRLAMLGGIDSRLLRRDPPAIRRELEYKMQPLMVKQGGIVFGLDHPIPADTPLENYRFYVDTAREILRLPPRTADKKGWRPMAF
jgi:uroporphyrinogen decarboxylase